MIIVSYFFFVVSTIFFISGLILLSKYLDDIGISLHATKILNIYAINTLLLAICCSNFSYQFLLEIIVIITINSLCFLTLLHILFKKSNIGDTEEYAKRREKTLEARSRYFKEYLKNNRDIRNINKTNNNIKTARTNEEQTNDDIDNDKILKSDDKSWIVRREIDFSTFFSDCMDKMDNNIEEPNKEDVNKAIDDAEEEIKKQKIALKRKIEDARKSAYATRKPEKMLETEKIIKEVLDKYGLTEEMLNV